MSNRNIEATMHEQGIVGRLLCLRWHRLPEVRKYCNDIDLNMILAPDQCISLLTGMRINYLRVTCRVFVDFVQYLCLCLGPSRHLAAENLFLRKQLALFKERNIKPRSTDSGTRLTMAFLSRRFDWQDALVIVQPRTDPPEYSIVLKFLTIFDRDIEDDRYVVFSSRKAAQNMFPRDDSIHLSQFLKVKRSQASVQTSSRGSSMRLSWL